MSEAFGPVSKLLENELRRKVMAKNLIVWLDTNGAYAEFVDSLIAMRAAGELSYDVVTFRDSFLEMLLELEPLTGGIARPALVIHMPGFNKETIVDTPLLEMYLAGTTYEKALATLVREAATGQVVAAQIDEYIAGRSLTLVDADRWLATVLADSASPLTGQLRMLSAEALLDDLLNTTSSQIATQLHSPADVDALWERFGAVIGLPLLWRDRMSLRTDRPTSPASLTELAFVPASWALCVEYANDRRSEPVDPQLKAARKLPSELVEACRRVACHLRDRHRLFYEATADDTELLLREEVEAARAEDLGKVDTFRFEEDQLLKAAIGALDTENWSTAASMAHNRIEGNSFWLLLDQQRRNAWQLIGDAAVLGERIVAAGPSLGDAPDHHAAIERYQQFGTQVDRAHRHLEQRRRTLLYPQVPMYGRLKSSLDAIRRYWLRWADGWARDFNALCCSHGFLPPAELQQRNLFEQVVTPLVSPNETTALFVVDALRLEMAEELMQSLSDDKSTTIRLDARLAELPTVTAVGMNVLAPMVRGGRLKPVIQGGKFDGFSTGEYRVTDPDSRRRAMHDRIGGKQCAGLTLREVIDRDTTSLKRSIAQSRLVVVHSKEIDDAGEAGLASTVFDDLLKDLRAAWRCLREAGVKQFVFTADHGFLLLDGIQDRVSHGRKSDPSRRHMVADKPKKYSDRVDVAMSDLGYEGTDQYLIFPNSTAPFDTGDHLHSFVHGGNSLQERVVPVLTLKQQRPAGDEMLKYAIAASWAKPVAGMHCLSATLSIAMQQHSLDFVAGRPVELALRVVDADDVSAELCDVRGGDATLTGGSIWTGVGERFELFFRLRGMSDQRVQVELYHPGALVDVAPVVIDRRFAVEVTPAASKQAAEEESAPTPASVPGDNRWLSEFEDEGVRKFFEHLSIHGTVTEAEASALLGGPRKLRRFSSEFEQHTSKARFDVRIDVVNGAKRYVREAPAGYEHLGNG